MNLAWVLRPNLIGSENGIGSFDYALNETIDLALSIDLEIRHAEHIKVRAPKTATLFGSGFLKKIHIC